MKDRGLRWLGIVTLALAITGAPARTQAGTSSDALLELGAARGPSIGLGFGLSPLHWDVMVPPAPVAGTAAAESGLREPEPRSGVISFDIKLRWPGAEPTSPLEPYLVFGPALFVDRPPEAAGFVGVPADPVLRLGARAGAGFNWRLSRDASLFGSYDVTTTDVGAKAPSSTGSTGYDILYGVRFRY